MAFKMKGPSMYPNYRGNNPKQQQVQINRDGNPGAADGRAASSPFQMNDDKKKKFVKDFKEKIIKKKTGPAKKKTMEDYISEGFTPSDARQMMKDGATTGKTSPNKFLGGILGKIGSEGAKGVAEGAKGVAKGVAKGAAGVVGMGDKAVKAAAGLFQQKGSPYKATKAAKKAKVTSKMVKNKDGSYTVTKSDGKRSASSTYKKANDPKIGGKDVYKNEHGQTRRIIG